MQQPGSFSLPVSDDAEKGHSGSQERDLGDHEAAVSAAPAAEPPLPCQYSTNCDGNRVKLCGKDRKRAEATQQNLKHLARLWGKRAGVLCLTFEKDLPTREAQRRFHNLCRRVLKEIFEDWVTIREFTFRGRPHFHLLGKCKGDIATGFNWEQYDVVKQWSRAGRKGAKPSGHLGRSPLLVRLHALLREKAPLYGFGSITELTPVRDPEAIGFYLAEYMTKDLAYRPGDAKGTRAVNYSHKCPRVFRGEFSFNTPGYWCYRMKRKKFAEEKHGCSSLGEARALLGPKWVYHFREEIYAMQLDYYPTEAHARADGFVISSFWEDRELLANAVHIRREVEGPRKTIPAVRHPSWDAGRIESPAVLAAALALVGKAKPAPLPMCTSPFAAQWKWNWRNDPLLIPKHLMPKNESEASF